MHAAWTMSQAHLMGQDGFGMAARWVPSMSVSTYLSRGTDAVKVLKDLEAKTATFWDAAAKAQQAQAGLGMQAQETLDSRGQMTTAKTDAQKAMATAREALDKAEVERTTQRGLLNDALAHFSGAIESSFQPRPEHPAELPESNVIRRRKLRRQRRTHRQPGRSGPNRRRDEHHRRQRSEGEYTLPRQPVDVLHRKGLGESVKESRAVSLTTPAATNSSTRPAASPT